MAERYMNFVFLIEICMNFLLFFYFWDQDSFKLPHGQYLSGDIESGLQGPNTAEFRLDEFFKQVPNGIFHSFWSDVGLIICFHSFHI